MGWEAYSGYVLLAVIIERVTGESFPSYLEENIFLPLGMRNSYVGSDFHQFGEFGEGAALNNANGSDVLDFNSLIYGSSGIVSSVEDMSMFINAWLNNMLVRQETKALTLQSHRRL